MTSQLTSLWKRLENSRIAWKIFWLLSLVYTLSFSLAYEVVGEYFFLFSPILVGFAAWTGRIRAGIMAWVLFLGINLSIHHLAGQIPWKVLLQSPFTLIGQALILVFAWVMGLIRTLQLALTATNQKLRQEILAHEQSKTNLNSSKQSLALVIDSISQPLTGAKVLLVEDDKISQEVAKRFLKLWKVETTTADHGAQALEELEKQSFDVVLMDLQMPGMDGYEAARRIRENKQFALLPIIAVSANAMKGEKERCMRYGMNDHVAKPINPDDLLAKLLLYVKPDAQKTSVAQPEDQSLTQSLNQTSELDLSRLDGIDHSLPLEIFDGNKELYKNLLNQFLLQSRSLAKQLNQQFQEGKITEAFYLVHKLRGSSSAIGAMELNRAAEHLQQAINLNESASYPALKDALVEKLTQVLTGIENALNSPMDN